jgi:hypothetical protein
MNDAAPFVLRPRRPLFVGARERGYWIATDDTRPPVGLVVYVKHVGWIATATRHFAIPQQTHSKRDCAVVKLLDALAEYERTHPLNRKV